MLIFPDGFTTFYVAQTRWEIRQPYLTPYLMEKLHFSPIDLDCSTDISVERLDPIPDCLQHIHLICVRYLVEGLLLVHADQACVQTSVLNMGDDIPTQC